MWRIFYDRNKSNVSGFLSVVNQKTKEVKFRRIPAQSGQFAHTEWVRGKSPIPFGNFWLCTKPEILQMKPKGTPFFLISSGKGDRCIQSEDKRQIRMNIGLHYENEYFGSAGCVVVYRTPQTEELFQFIQGLDEKYIPFIVL